MHLRSSGAILLTTTLVFALFISIDALYLLRLTPDDLVATSISTYEETTDLQGIMQIMYDEKRTALATIALPAPTYGGDGAELVNINLASAEEMLPLPMIGEYRASQIINHRREFGPFTCNEEVLEVSGIGEKTYAAIVNLITCGEE